MGRSYLEKKYFKKRTDQSLQKQPFRGVLRKITGGHPCRSAISIKLLCNFIEIALRHACSPVKLMHIFRASFPKNIPGWLLLSLRAYKKQKNYCSRLYKNERKRFFNELNPSFVTNNKLFWKTVKPFFSDKGNYGANINGGKRRSFAK